MRVDRPRTLRLEAITPVLEGSRHERGLPFDNGRYVVTAHRLNGRGHPTGELIRIASFASPELADLCRDRINAQNHAFQAQVEIDEREDHSDEAEAIMWREWPGATAIQDGPYYVSATFLDHFGRWAGGGIVSFFADKASADACVAILNAEHPAHEAVTEEYPEFESAA